MSDVCEGCKYEYTCFCAEACKECIRVNSQSFVDFMKNRMLKIMADKVSSEDFIKAFGKGVKDNRKITPIKINYIRDHVFVRRAARDMRGDKDV